MEPRGKPGSRGEEGDPSGARALKTVHPVGKKRDRKREKYLGCATAKKKNPI